MLCSDPPKVAVTELAALNATLQLVAPVHPPDHPAKVLPVAGVSLKVTNVFGAKIALHAVVDEFEQSIPAGVLVTVPAPAPAVATVSPKPALKLPATVVAPVMVTLQVLGPEQPPLHPSKKKLALGVAVNVTWALVVKLAVQVPGQLIATGLLVIVPSPAGGGVTVSW